MSKRFVVFEDPVLQGPSDLGPSASALNSRLQALRDVTNTKQKRTTGKGALPKAPPLLTVRQVR